MASRILRSRVQTMPSLVDVEPAGQDPVSLEDEVGLASLAAISGVPLDNRSVSTFIGTLNNQAIAAIAAAQGTSA